MIEQIKELLASQQNLNEKKGIFLSAFDRNNALLTSNGVLVTNKALTEVAETLYKWLIASYKEVKYIVGDIIEQIAIKTSMEDIMQTDMTIYGICASTLDHTKSGVVLPNTLWISTASDALGYIKQRNNLSGNITVYTFTTKRFYVHSV